MLWYLRIVHSFDYYNAIVYPDEDGMPHRCGIIHCRGAVPTGQIAQSEGKSVLVCCLAVIFSCNVGICLYFSKAKQF